MRPQKERSRKPQYGVSRARLLLKKNLGWLPGFPVELDSDTIRWHAWPWKDPGTSRLISLNREALRRMEMALSKLRHHFPRALPQILEDVGDWLARMDCLLDMLKGVIHRQSPLNVEMLMGAGAGGGRWAQRICRLRATWPELGRLLEAVAFLEFTAYQSCDLAVLEWIDSNAASLSRLGSSNDTLCDPQLLLCTLREDIDMQLRSFLLDTLANPASCSAPVGDDYHDYLSGLAREVKNAANGRSFAIPPKPISATMGQVCERFLKRLLAVKPMSRRHMAKLMGSLVSADLKSKAEALALSVQGEESKFLEILRREQRHGFLECWPKDTREDVKKLLDFEWDSEAHQLLNDTELALSYLSMIADKKSHLELWTHFLACLPPDEQLIRPGLFARWERERRESWVDSRRTNQQFRRILSELSNLLTRRGGHERLFQYWRKDEPISGLLDDREDANRVIQQWCRLLEITLYDQKLPLGDKLLGSLEQFVRATPDITQASRLVAALAKQEDDYYFEDSIRGTLAIAAEDSDLAAMQRKLDDDDELAKHLILLGPHLPERRLRRIVEQWLLSDQKKALLELASCMGAAVQLGLSVPQVTEIESSADWLAGYPDKLRAPLDELRRVTAEAETIVAQILHKEFPDTRHLQKEAQAIRLKLEGATIEQDPQLRDRLRKRLENLEHRIVQPRPVTPQRLEHLASKIRDRVDYEMVQRYLQECRDMVTQALRERYGVRLAPDQLFAPPRDQLLSGILQLQDPMRELGLRLLFKSIEDPTCDFRTKPQNVGFLDALRKKGIRLEPWLDDSFEQTATTADGEPYRLFFARRIDDVLLMGLHFDTCLSPHQQNFFSTISNALDINKQVVYAKTASSRVIGRSLFALTDEGTLLTYCRYAHDPKDGFKQQVDEFAIRLAQAMNTNLAGSGRVSKLVSQKWYDDGALSREAIYDLYNADGIVRTILRTEQVSRIIEKLVTVLRSENALASLLGSLLFLEEFQQRREIVKPFLDRYAFEPGTPAQVRFRLAILARPAGQGEMAHRIVRSLRINSLPRRLKRLECYHCGGFHGAGTYDEVFDLLMECNPSIALRTLHVTRPKGAKSDADETHPKRKALLARCYQALRPDS